ncbi:hypothetical protein ABPG74_017266 [Tetrahymena malaccensis]
MLHSTELNQKQKIKCQVCLEEVVLIEDDIVLAKCSCLKQACKNCLYLWTLESLTNSISIVQKDIKCMNKECESTFLLSDILPLLKKQQQETICDITLTRFLSNSKDCMQCQHCQIYSFKQEEQICSNPYNCPHCEQNCFFEEQESLQTVLYELFLTDPCPQCGVHIQKTGGCSTMECKKCDFKFCWYCKKPGENKHNRKHCIGHQAAKWMIYCNITTNIFLILNLQMYIGQFIQFLLSSIGNIFFGSFIIKFFFYNMLLVFVVMTILGLKSTIEIIVKIIKENQQGSYVEKYYKKRRKFIKKTLFSLFMSLLEILIIDFNNCFFDMVKFIFWELVLIVSFIAIYVSFSLISHFIKKSKKDKFHSKSSIYTYNYTDWLSKISKQKNLD